MEDPPGHCRVFRARVQKVALARRFNEFNEWKTIFDATATRSGVGLRLLFCDGILQFSDWPYHREENCPVLPVGTFTFSFEMDSAGYAEICTRVLHIERPEQKAMWEWALLGMCRREPGTLASHFRELDLEHTPRIRKQKVSLQPREDRRREVTVSYRGQSHRGRACHRPGGPDRMSQ